MISAREIISSLVLIHVQLQKCLQVRRNKDLIRSLSLDVAPGSPYLLVVLAIRRPKAAPGLLTNLLSFLAFKSTKNTWSLQKALESGLISSRMLFRLLWAFGFSPFVLRSSMGCKLIAFQTLCLLCDQNSLLCNLGHCFATLQIKETWMWLVGSEILKQELRKQK